MAKQLLGKEVTAALNERIRDRVAKLKNQGVYPQLCIIRVGEKPEDISYERGASKRCELVGISHKTILIPTDVTTGELLSVIDEVNRDKSVHGVLMFRPLPKTLDRRRIENALDPAKDIDCMTDASLNGVFTGKNIGYPPCTAQACLEVLDHYQIDCTGKNVVVIGRSLVVGKPVSMMLLSRNATVTICHTRTVDLPQVARQADILVATAGRARIIGPDFVREGQVVLDVGINVDEDGKLCGDADYEKVEPIVEAITPVPGGIGSVTTSVLAVHVVRAAEKTMQKI